MYGVQDSEFAVKVQGCRLCKPPSTSPGLQIGGRISLGQHVPAGIPTETHLVSL